MPAPELQTHLEQLRSQLGQGQILSEDERAALLAIARDIETRLERETPSDPDDSLVDGVNLAVERFEVTHPNMAMTLRNIMQSLASMGI